MDELNKKIYQKLVLHLNQNGYNTKEKLSQITKEQLKPILHEIYTEFNSLGSIVNSQKLIWKKVAEEVITENSIKEDEKFVKKESKQYLKNLDNKSEQLNSEDYDDLILPEFPTEYNESLHAKKMEKLSGQLEMERREESRLLNEYNLFVENEIKNFEEVKDKNKEEIDKAYLDEKIKEEKINLKKKIKDNKYMKNDEFLLLLCIMRKKKEQLYENNPYFVDFNVTLDNVYQSEKDENEEETKFILNNFDIDLNKYVD